MTRDEPVLRVMRTKDEARRSYDRLSRWYDLISGAGEYNLAAETLALMDLPAGGAILEVGFGTGRILLEVARQVGANGRVYGVDLSPGMCQLTHHRLAKAGLLDRVFLTTADGYRLPLVDESLDCIFMGFTLELFDTPELLPVLRECLRTLKPGGRMGIVAMSVSDKPGALEQLYLLAHKSWPQLVDCRPIDLVSLLNEGGISLKELVHKKLWGLSVAKVVLLKHE
jgi:ubiquinone/menaquinone biosynthesis C-methylase UbiE